MDKYLWLLFACGTIICWGSYGPVIHTSTAALKNPWKALLLVGVAYFVLAIVIPTIMLKLNGVNWDFNSRGTAFGLIAGTLGALGAMCVICAMANIGKANVPPVVVMPIIFGCAPLINVVVSWLQHKPTAWPSWQFYVGILCLSGGASLVLLYKPDVSH